MNNEDGETILEFRASSPANDDLARMMDWVGLSAAIAMLVVAVVIAG